MTRLKGCSLDQLSRCLRIDQGICRWAPPRAVCLGSVVTKPEGHARSQAPTPRRTASRVIGSSSCTDPRTANSGLVVIEGSTSFLLLMDQPLGHLISTQNVRVSAFTRWTPYAETGNVILH